MINASWALIFIVFNSFHSQNKSIHLIKKYLLSVRDKAVKNPCPFEAYRLLGEHR